MSKTITIPDRRSAVAERRRSIALEEIRYGDDRTIHCTGHVDVEVDNYGKVVAVWFRCMPIKFEQAHADSVRAAEMRRMYEKSRPLIKAIITE